MCSTCCLEGCFTQAMVQRIVLKFDPHRGSGAAVDDAGNLAGVTQTAARTGTLQFTLGGDDFDFHSFLLFTYLMMHCRKWSMHAQSPRDQGHSQPLFDE